MSRACNIGDLMSVGSDPPAAWWFSSESWFIVPPLFLLELPTLNLTRRRIRGPTSYSIALATNCSILRSSIVATAVTFALPNCPKSEAALSYSTAVLPSSFS
jgi:hypothetical protein